MSEVFLSEYLGLNNELEEEGVFDAVITSDSNFFINVLRLKQTTVPEFRHSYDKIKTYFEKIMMLLVASREKGDKLYETALKRFSFSGVREINLGFSLTGVVDAFRACVDR